MNHRHVIALVFAATSLQVVDRGLAQDQYAFRFAFGAYCG